MNEQKIEILRKELEAVEWDIKYHFEKLAKAKYLRDLYNHQLESLSGEDELLKDYTDAR